jgi:endonuclease-3
MQELEKLLEILSKKLNKNPSAENLAVGKNKSFRVLVSTILSTRTRDETTEEICKKLFKVIEKPEDLIEINQEELEKLIYPVGFYKIKAENLKKLGKILVEKKKIPNTMKELLKLPGVGRKVANIVLNVGFGKEGLAVDTHVHRICNRFEYIDTKIPNQTEMELRKKLPKKYWRDINRLLVVFGKEICGPKPKCKICFEEIRKFCPYFKKLNSIDRFILHKFQDIFQRA